MQPFFHVNENRLNQQLLSRYKTWACYACGISILLGLMVLAGWALGIPIFRSLFFNKASVNPLSAVCLTLSGISLYMLVLTQPSRLFQSLGIGLALLVGFIGFYRRFTYALGWNFTWDQWLFSGRLAQLGNDPTNLMSPHTAFNFLLLSFALLLQQWSAAKYAWVAQLLVLVLASIGLISLVSYVYHIESYYTTDKYVMSFYTALGFTCLGFGFLFGTARTGFMQVLASQGSGGIMARRLLPLVLLVTFMLDFLRLGAQQANLYYAAALLISLSLPLFFILICWNAWSLNRSEELLSGVLNSSIDGVIAFQAVRDPKGTIQDFTYRLLNSSAEQLLGRSRSELIGKQILTEYPGTSNNLFHKYVKVVESGEPLHYEFFYESEGFKNWFLVKAVKYEDGLVANFTDTTQQKTAQEKITKSDLLLQQSQSIGKVGSFEWDIVHSILTGSQELYRIFGYDYPEEIDPEKFFARVHPDDRRLLNSYILEGLTTLEEYSIEFRIITPAQPTMFVWVKGRKFFDAQDKPERMIGTILDITEKKKVEEELQHKNLDLQHAYEELVATQEELRETNEALEHRVKDRTEKLTHSQERYQAFVQQSSEAIWRIELAGIPFIDTRLSPEEQIDLCYKHAYLAECNDAMAQMYGFSSAIEFVGIPIADMLPRSEPSNINWIQSFIQAGYRLTNAESIELDVQGNTKYFLNNLIGFIEGNKLIRLWGIQRDITNHKQAEREREELLKREQTAFAETERQRARWQSLFMQAPAIICIFRGPEHIVDFVNPAFEKLFTNRAFLGKLARDSYPEMEPTGIFDYLDQVYTTGEAFVASEMEIRLDRLNNGVLVQGFFNFVFQAIRDTNGTIEGILVFATEVTDQVLARKVVEENAEKFRLLLESLPQITWTALPDGILNYFNQRWYEYTGLTPEQSMNNGWHTTRHPDELPSTLEKWSYSILTGQTFVQKSRLRRSSDNTYRWHLTQAVPIWNEQQKITLWIGSCTDIHDQQIAMEEIATAQEQLFQANDELNKTNRQLRKINEDLDNFVYSASHDLKAPMANLEGLVALLSRQIGMRSNVQEQAIIDMMLISVNKFNQTIRDMTDITKVQKSLSDATEPVYFEEVLADIKIDIAHLMQQVNTCITTDFAVEKIQFARKNLRSILYNLVSNAIKYHSAERPPAVHIITRQEAQMICLSVRDNGLGIDPEQKPKLFGMFKRLHTHVEGTGIGLYIVKKIVDNNGGNIEVESILGEGTTFTIYLPII